MHDHYGIDGDCFIEKEPCSSYQKLEAQLKDAIAMIEYADKFIGFAGSAPKRKFFEMRAEYRSKYGGGE